MIHGIRLFLRAIGHLRDLFERLVDAAYDKAYDWACGAYKVNWLLVLYFGVFVPVMIYGLYKLIFFLRTY
jgi:hypothetical protein